MELFYFCACLMVYVFVILFLILFGNMRRIVKLVDLEFIRCWRDLSDKLPSLDKFIQYPLIKITSNKKTIYLFKIVLLEIGYISGYTKKKVNLEQSS